MAVLNMDRFYPAARSDFGTLFEEDFDRPPAPPPPPEPEVIEPVFSLAEVEAAREAGWQDGHAAGREQADQSNTALARQVLVRIATQLDTARDEAARLTEEAAEAMAHLLLDCFATAFPALTERHGPGEVQAIIRTVLPALRQEPKITVRLDAATARVVAAEIEHLDPDLPERVELVPTDALGPGDVRITWRNGAAIRNSRTLWQQIADILAPAGLLPPQPAAKEIERVE
jgi:flagellar assembly protein FliH